jgi:hypothetical protein
MTPRVATNNTSEKDTLTEAETLSLADLKVKDRAGLLTDTSERLRYKSLLAAQPTPLRELSLGARVVTGHDYREFAAKALKVSNGSTLPITEDVSLANIGPARTKALLRMGVATSAGAFQSLDDSGEYAPARRPLELLDLVRAGTTDEGAVQYVRQTTYTPLRLRWQKQRQPQPVRSPRHTAFRADSESG